jgi:hypothetical protein
MANKRFTEKMNDDNFIYHCFTFDPKIQEHTFLGEEFFGMDQSVEREALRTFDRIVDAGPEGFMPQIVSELKEIFGEGNYKYDGYEIGEDERRIFEFNLYFFIKKSLYDALIKKVELWSELNGFRNLISWQNKLSKEE